MLFKRTLNFIAVLVTLTVNGLANALPFNGQTTGSISDRFPVLFTPAGYVFSIWGIIYLGLLAFGVYQLLPGQRSNPRLERIGYWFALSCLFNSAWIFFWHFNYFALTLVIMLGLLGSLLIIYLRLNIGFGSVSTTDKWLVNLPFSIYLGWISVATIANFSVVLYNSGWTSGGLFPIVWTLVLLAVGTVLGSAMIIRRREVAFPLVLVWAFVGIWQKQSSTNLAVGAAAVTAAALLLVVLAVFRKRREV
jgi:benzodiazapine receptor